MVSGIIGRLRYLVYFSPMFVKYSQKWSAISFEFDIFLLFIMNVWGMLVLSLDDIYYYNYICIAVA